MTKFLTYKTEQGVIHRMIDPAFNPRYPRAVFHNPIAPRRPTPKRKEARCISLSDKIILGDRVHRIESIQTVNDHDIKFTFVGGTSTTVPQNLQMMIQ